MWFTYTMEYYSAIKNENIMNLAGKWMELENIILSEATHSQKETHAIYSLILNISKKYKRIHRKQTIELKVYKYRAYVRMPQQHLGGNESSHREQSERGTWLRE